MATAKFLGWAIGKASDGEDVWVPSYELDGQNVFALDGKLKQAYPTAVGVEALLAEAARIYELHNVTWRPFTASLKP